MLGWRCNRKKERILDLSFQDIWCLGLSQLSIARHDCLVAPALGWAATNSRNGTRSEHDWAFSLTISTRLQGPLTGVGAVRTQEKGTCRLMQSENRRATDRSVLLSSEHQKHWPLSIRDESRRSVYAT